MLAIPADDKIVAKRIKTKLIGQYIYPEHITQCELPRERLSPGLQYY